MKELIMTKTIKLLFFLLIATTSISFADSMTVSQKIMFVGFSGAQFKYVPPSDAQLKETCGDGNADFKYAEFPVYMPPKDPEGNPADSYSMKFSYDVPLGSNAICAAPLTTRIQWKTGTTVHSCYFTTVIGGGAENHFTIISTGKTHRCQIGDEKGQNADCYSNDCNPDSDSDKDLWMVYPK